MARGTQQMDSDPKAEAKHYMREALRKGTSLTHASAQWTNHGLIIVLQRTVKSWVGVEHQTTTCLQPTSARLTDHDLMAMLQRTTMARVVAS